MFSDKVGAGEGRREGCFRLIAVLRATAAGTAAIDLLLSIARTQRSTPMWRFRPVEVANAGPCTLPTLDKNILLATYRALLK